MPKEKNNSLVVAHGFSINNKEMLKKDNKWLSPYNGVN